MWVIFLLSGVSVAICILCVAYIGNKILIAMEKDRKKARKRKCKKENEK